MDQTSFLPMIKTKTNYTEAFKYFGECEKKLLTDSCNDIKTNCPENSCTTAEVLY